MLVKKFTEKRAFSTVSLGNTPCMYCFTSLCSSLSLSANFFMPKFSAISWNRFLMKMRLDEVVSSSVISMLDSTCDSHPFNIPFH